MIKKNSIENLFNDIIEYDKQKRGINYEICKQCLNKHKKMQKDMMEAKNEIDNMIFEETNSFVTIKANGKKEILEVKIDNDSMDKDDIEMMQDIIVVLTNSIFKKD